MQWSYFQFFLYINRLVRQGCGLSTLLYVVCRASGFTELEHNSLNSVNVKGCNGKSLTYQQADDITSTFADKNFITKGFELLDIYWKASGAKVNVEK